MSEGSRDEDVWRRWTAPTVGARRDPRPGPAGQGKGRSESGSNRAGKDAEATSSAKKPVTAAEIESIQEAAYREAYDKGYQEGLKAGEDKVKQRAREVAALLEALSDPLQALDREVEEEISDLVCVIARQLIRRELRTDPGQIVAVVRDAVGALPSSDRQVRVQLHPEDASLIREVAGGSSHDARWELIEDPSLTRGGCVVSDRNSRVDMRLEQQIGRVLATMLGEERAVPEAESPERSGTEEKVGDRRGDPVVPDDEGPPAADGKPDDA